MINTYKKKIAQLKTLSAIVAKYDNKSIQSLVAYIKKHTDIVVKGSTNFFMKNGKPLLSVPTLSVLSEDNKLIAHLLCAEIDKAIELNYIELQKTQYNIEHEDELIEKYNSLVLQLEEAYKVFSKEFIAHNIGKFRVFHQ